MPSGQAEVATPQGRTLEALIRSGRPAEVFCRLARTRFTGVVYAEHDEGGGIFSFRDGMPVFAEDLGDAPLLADDLLVRGLIDAAQYAEIGERVIALGPDNEDICFCEVAVSLGALTQAQVDSELERRLRGRIVQAVGWSRCRIELDPDPDSVAAVAQFPQDLGPLIATGVRTFCDESAVRELLGPLDTLYVRLSVTEAEPVQFFELADEDEALLSALKPDVPVARTIDDAGGDWLEGWQLVLMLAMAEHLEVGRVPFSPATERSGVRSSHALTGASGRYTATSGVREERVRTDSIGRMPAVTTGATAPTTSAASAAAREAVPKPAASAPAAPTRATSQSSTSVERTRPDPVQTAAAAAASRTAAQRPVSSTTVPAVRPEPVTTNVSSPARPIQRRDPKRKLSSALQRLERNLKDLRTVPVAAPTPAPASAATASSTAVPRTRSTSTSALTTPIDAATQRAHVEQLMRMRYGKQRPDSSPHAAKPPSEPSKTPAELFRQAQDLMRDNQWPRAHEVMRKVCEQDTANEQYLMYQRWTALRANVLDEDGMSKFRLSLRDKLSDEIIGKFAYYALGHLALVEKKDDAAEKLFRKALELDKHNKDAERHLRIIELRRKSAQTQANNKIFGIEIGKKKS